MVRNPTKKEKKEYKYKEQLQYGQGIDLEPKSNYEINASKSKNTVSKESDEEIRLSGSRNQHYFSNEKGLGSPLNHDDYGNESSP